MSIKLRSSTSSPCGFTRAAVAFCRSFLPQRQIALSSYPRVKLTDAELPCSLYGSGSKPFLHGLRYRKDWYCQMRSKEPNIDGCPSQSSIHCLFCSFISVQLQGGFSCHVSAFPIPKSTDLLQGTQTNRQSHVKPKVLLARSTFCLTNWHRSDTWLIDDTWTTRICEVRLSGTWRGLQRTWGDGSNCFRLYLDTHLGNQSV